MLILGSFESHTSSRQVHLSSLESWVWDRLDELRQRPRTSVLALSAGFQTVVRYLGGEVVSAPGLQTGLCRIAWARGKTRRMTEMNISYRDMLQAPRIPPTIVPEGTLVEKPDVVLAVRHRRLPWYAIAFSPTDAEAHWSLLDSWQRHVELSPTEA